MKGTLSEPPGGRPPSARDSDDGGGIRSERLLATDWSRTGGSCEPPAGVAQEEIAGAAVARTTLGQQVAAPSARSSGPLESAPAASCASEPRRLLAPPVGPFRNEKLHNRVAQQTITTPNKRTLRI